MAVPWASQWLPVSHANLSKQSAAGELVVVVSPSGRGNVGQVGSLSESGFELVNGNTRQFVSFAQRGLRFAKIPLPEGMRFGQNGQKILPF